MVDPFPYPDLPLDICGEIFAATVREIRALADPAVGADPAGLLEPVVGKRIYECESIESALDDETLTSDVPALLLALGPCFEIRTANGGESDLTTAVDMGLLSPVTSAFDTQNQFRWRFFHQVKLRLMREQGTLRSGDGERPEEPGDPGYPDNRITSALKGYGRIDPGGRLIRRTNVLLTKFRVTFSSTIDEATRQFIG